MLEFGALFSIKSRPLQNVLPASRRQKKRRIFNWFCRQDVGSTLFCRGLTMRMKRSSSNNAGSCCQKNTRDEPRPPRSIRQLLCANSRARQAHLEVAQNRPNQRRQITPGVWGFLSRNGSFNLSVRFVRRHEQLVFIFQAERFEID